MNHIEGETLAGGCVELTPDQALIEFDSLCQRALAIRRAALHRPIPEIDSAELAWCDGAKKALRAAFPAVQFGRQSVPLVAADLDGPRTIVHFQARTIDFRSTMASDESEAVKPRSGSVVDETDVPREREKVAIPLLTVTVEGIDRSAEPPTASTKVTQTGPRNAKRVPPKRSTRNGAANSGSMNPDTAKRRGAKNRASKKNGATKSMVRIVTANRDSKTRKRRAKANRDRKADLEQQIRALEDRQREGTRDLTLAEIGRLQKLRVQLHGLSQWSSSRSVGGRTGQSRVGLISIHRGGLRQSRGRS